MKPQFVLAVGIIGFFVALMLVAFVFAAVSLVGWSGLVIVVIVLSALAWASYQIHKYLRS